MRIVLIFLGLVFNFRKSVFPVTLNFFYRQDMSYTQIRDMNCTQIEVYSMQLILACTCTGNSEGKAKGNRYRQGCSRRVVEHHPSITHLDHRLLTRRRLQVCHRCSCAEITICYRDSRGSRGGCKLLICKSSIKYKQGWLSGHSLWPCPYYEAGSWKLELTREEGRSCSAGPNSFPYVEVARDSHHVWPIGRIHACRLDMVTQKQSWRTLWACLYWKNLS